MPAGDREDPLDRVGELLAGGVRVAGVEAEAEVDPGLGVADRLPEPRDRVEAPGDGVLAAGGVLEQHRTVGLEHLQRAQPAPRALGRVVLGVAAVDDHRRGADLGRRVAGLLEDLARAVADVRLRRADVDQVRRVHVEIDRGWPGSRRPRGGEAAFATSPGRRGRSARSRRRGRPRPRAALLARDVGADRDLGPAIAPSIGGAEAAPLPCLDGQAGPHPGLHRVDRRAGARRDRRLRRARARRALRGDQLGAARRAGARDAASTAVALSDPRRPSAPRRARRGPGARRRRGRARADRRHRAPTWS